MYYAIVPHISCQVWWSRDSIKMAGMCFMENSACLVTAFGKKQALELI
jgi:hypothetical protein